MLAGLIKFYFESEKRTFGWKKQLGDKRKRLIAATGGRVGGRKWGPSGEGGPFRPGVHGPRESVNFVEMKISVRVRHFEFCGSCSVVVDKDKAICWLTTWKRSIIGCGRIEWKCERFTADSVSGSISTHSMIASAVLFVHFEGCGPVTLWIQMSIL